MGELFIFVSVFFPKIELDQIFSKMKQHENPVSSTVLYQPLMVLTTPSWQPGLTPAASGCCQLPLHQSTVWMANVV